MVIRIRLPALYVPGIGPSLNGAVPLPSTASAAIVAHALREVSE